MYTKKLIDPVAVSHQGNTIVFAREGKDEGQDEGKKTSSLYFRVLSPSAALDRLDTDAWTEWYRFDFPGAAYKMTTNRGAQAEAPQPEIRVAGMELLTMPMAVVHQATDCQATDCQATDFEPADAPFQIVSDGDALCCFRPSSHSTIYADRLCLQEIEGGSSGKATASWELIPAREFRFRRSENADLPADKNDTRGTTSLDGRSFFAPTMELPTISAGPSGKLSVARAPTMNGGSRWYFASILGGKVHLWSVLQVGPELVDMRETISSYELLLSGCAASTDTIWPLTPQADIGTAMTFYAEHEPVGLQDGNQVEAQRAGRLMMVIPVTNTEGAVSCVSLDFSLDGDGKIADPGDTLKAVLVDATVDNGQVKPDQSSPFYPMDAAAAVKTQLLGGRLTAMWLCQVVPSVTPTLRVDADGLIHLYYCGAKDRLATAVRFDTRVDRLIIDLPCKGDGAAASLVARRSGPSMAGTIVQITSSKDKDVSDLCDMVITSPDGSIDNWHNIPRELSAFAAILNGKATNDPADPAALSGTRAFFDFRQDHSMVRVPLRQKDGMSLGALTFVSTNADITLRDVQVKVSSQGKVGITVHLRDTDNKYKSISLSWTDLDIASLPDELGGSTGREGKAKLFALNTDSPGVWTPVIFYPGEGDFPTRLTVLAEGTTLTLTATFTEGDLVVVKGLSPSVNDFAKELRDDSKSPKLKLGVSCAGAAGNVVPTPANGVERLSLSQAVVLFELLVPNVNLATSQLVAGTFNAFKQSHETTNAKGTIQSPLFTLSHVPAKDGAPALVQNTGPALKTRTTRTGQSDTPRPGRWLREDTRHAATLAATDQLKDDTPSSTNLHPTWGWTFESWLLPAATTELRCVATAGQKPDFAVGVIGRSVLSMNPGGSVRLPVGISAQHTMELWVNPTKAGRLAQINTQSSSWLHLDIDSHYSLTVTGTGIMMGMLTSKTALQSGAWNRIVFRYDGALNQLSVRVGSGAWNSTAAQLFTVGDRWVIGGASDSFTGLFTELRIWSEARSDEDLARYELVSLSGSEDGLDGLDGCWPLQTVIGEQSHGGRGPSGSEPASVTGPVKSVRDSSWLSTVATVAGLHPIEAATLLKPGSWSHLAVTYRAGGAVRLNEKSSAGAAQVDHVSCSRAHVLCPGQTFAIDGWIRLSNTFQGPGSILSRWSASPDNAGKSYDLRVNEKGMLELWVMTTDGDGNTRKRTMVTMIALQKDRAYHVAATFSAKSVAPGSGGNDTDKLKYKCVLELWIDGKNVAYTLGNLEDKDIQMQSSATDVLLGRSGAMSEGLPPQSPSTIAAFQGKIGRVRFWTEVPAPEVLFPEVLFPERSGQRRAAQRSNGLSAEWSFNEQSGRIASDPVGGNEATLSSADLWSSIDESAQLLFIANGVPVATTLPYTGKFAPTASGICLGKPTLGGQGFVGSIARVELWKEARSVETIRDTRFVPLVGDERALLAAWDFRDGMTADLTGGGIDLQPGSLVKVASPPPPISTEGPWFAFAYGNAPDSSWLATAPGRIAVEAYGDVQTGTSGGPIASLKRQVVLDPDSPMLEPLWLGELDLVYVGQAQSNPTLLGYIEGAPPLPGENLDRPDTDYTGSASVALIQSAAKRVEVSSSRRRAGSLTLSGKAGLALRVEASAFGIKVAEAEAKIQLAAQLGGTFGTEFGAASAAQWLAERRDEIGASRDWRREGFALASTGYALVESITVDVYAAMFHATKCAAFTFMIPSAGMRPDRSIVLFPMDAQYTKAGTLDGKHGFDNDPDYPDANLRRGSYFHPVEAYALAAKIERESEKDRLAREGYHIGRGRVLQSDISDAAVPRRGLANRYVWTAAGGFHAETMSFASSTRQTYSGFSSIVGGAGIHAEGLITNVVGFAGELDLMLTGSLEVNITAASSTEEQVSLEVRVDGERDLRNWGSSSLAPASGKVAGYRFMTFYLPASRDNAETFKRVVAPDWLALSSDAAARVLRELGGGASPFRVLHRVTQVERVPPEIASRPAFNTEMERWVPGTLQANAVLIHQVRGKLADKQHPSTIEIGNAVSAVLDPPDNAPPALASVLPWWQELIAAARGDRNGPVNKMVQELRARTLAYMLAGYQTGVIQKFCND